MWIKCEGTSEPCSLDKASSKKYNYVRRNIVKMSEADSEDPDIWQWEENKVLKSDWETYEQVIDHGTALDDVYAALTELAELIEG